MKWSYRAEMEKMVKSWKSEFDLVLWSFDPKIIRGSSQVKYICEVSLLYVEMKWSCGAETVEKV